MLHLSPCLITDRRFYLKLLSISIILFLLSMQVKAQSTIVAGKINDEKNNPIPFASVSIKGSKTGVSADANGQFALKVNAFPVVFVIQAAGYIKTEQSLTAAKKSDSLLTITVILKADAGATLKEVVVTSAFGTKRASKSVASSVSGYLDGKVAGLKVKSISDIKDESSSSYNAKQTKLLTAGELSDFKKWKLWEGYSNTEFRAYSEKWNLYANARYTVQLQNTAYKAITGQLVYLVNGNSGDTLWTAVSDNTGKAELWDNFDKHAIDDVEQQLEIVVKGETKRYAASKFEKGINVITLNRNCHVYSKVEIAFVVDATGSMGDEIAYLKEELGDILLKIPSKDPSIDLHTGAVFYKDSRDEYITKVQPFTAGAQQTIDFIKKQYAGGGGDYPEAVKEALQAATEKLEWSTEARTKIIFLVLDAPPHDDTKAELAVLIRNAAAKGIRIVPVACSGTDKTTEFILRSIALATNGNYIFLTDDSGIGNKHIKPTTDEFKVELLNDLLQRVIAQMCYVNSCETNKLIEQPLAVYKGMDSVKVFPNPTTGPVTLETDLKITDIFVADFTGKILRRIDVRKRRGSYRFNLFDLPAATYFIRYVTEDNKAGAEKVVLLR